MLDFSGNLFLASLAPADKAELERHLRPAELTLGQVIAEQGEGVERAVFPIDAQLANIVQLDDGGTVEVAMVGREGLGGLAPIMSDRPCGWQVRVRTSGGAFVGPAAAVRSLQRTSTSFMARLLDLTQFYQEQAAQVSACNAHHVLPARLARWLLTALDMSPSDTLRFTQEELASLLGCQRTTVNEAAQALASLKALAYSRGQIRILDRTSLEKASCECYDALKARAGALNVVTAKR